MSKPTTKARILWEHSEFNLPVHIITSKRRKKTISIQVLTDAIVVRAPADATRNQIAGIIKRQRQWLQATVEQQRILAEQTAANNRNWRHHLLYQGEPLRLTYNSATNWNAKKQESTLFVSGPNNNDADIRSTVIGWYRTQAEAIIRQRLEFWSGELHAQYNQVRIKDLKSRWGSCSARRNLNFNWRLVCAPLPVLDYVIVHELCHLWEMNHSSNFWERVRQAFPTYKTQRAWLKDNGKSLYF